LKEAIEAHIQQEARKAQLLRVAAAIKSREM